MRAEYKLLDSQLTRLFLFSILFFIGATLGQFITSGSNYTVTLWPPSGISVAILLIIDKKKWHQYLLIAFLTNIFFDLIHGRYLTLSLFFSTGNILEALTCALFVKLFIKEKLELSSIKELGVIFIGSFICSSISATIGHSAAKILYGIEIHWFLWWSGDVAGVLIFTPLIISIKNYFTKAKIIRPKYWLVELLLVLILSITVSIFVFLNKINNYPAIEFLIIIPLLWSAIRFSITLTSICNALLTCIAIYGTANGYGPFAQEVNDVTMRIVAFQIFIGGIVFIVQLISIIFSEKKKLLEQVRVSEIKYKLLFDSAGDPIYIHDESGKILEVNRAAEEVTGYSNRELKLMKVTDIDSPEENSKASGRLAELMKNGFISFETVHKRKDGSLVNIDVNANKIKWAGEDAIINMCRDISERKKAEMEILLSETRLRRAELASKSGNWELHLTKKLMLASEGATIIYGLTDKILDYEMVAKVPLPEYRSQLDLALKNLIENNEPYDIEFKIRTIDTGEIKDVHSIALYDKERKILFGVIQDITEKKKVEEASRKNEALLKSIMENTPDTILQVNSEGNISYINKPVPGLTEKDIVGTSIYKWVPEEQYPVLKKTFENVFASGEKGEYESLGPGPNGESRSYLVKVNPVIIDGKTERAIYSASDITARKLVEKELKQSEEKFRTYIEDAPVGIFICDEKGIYTEVNQEASDLTGYTRNELIGMNLMELIYEKDKPIVEQQFLTVVKTGKISGENRFVKKNGEVGYWQLKGIKINDSCYVGFVLDRTEAKRTEEKERTETIRRRKEAEVVTKATASANLANGRFREFAAEITEAASGTLKVERAGVWLFNGDHSQLINLDNFIASANDHSTGAILFEAEYKNEFDALRNSKYIAADNALTDPRTTGYVESYLKPLKITSMLDALIRLEGINLGVLCLEHVENLHEWEDDEITFACQLADQIALSISHFERIQAEEELNKYREHLEEIVKSRTKELNAINKALVIEIEKKNEAERLLSESYEKEKELSNLKSRFISTASHEFRTPLTSILMSTGLIQRFYDKWDKEKTNKHFERVKNSVSNLTKLIDDVITLNRADSGKIVFAPQLINLKELCTRNVEEILHSMNEKYKIELRYNCKNENIRMDAKQIDTILQNLLSNALKYSPKQSNIQLEISEDGNNILISVTDKGIGIPEEDIPHLFEPFHRAKNVDEFQGSGLGLSIVKNAVQLHQGEIKVESEIGKGTKFTVVLPYMN